MNDTTRTFRARYLVIVETAVLSAHDYLLEFTGYGAAIQITLDGKRCSKAVAEAITKLALNLGTFERLSGPSLEATQPATLTKRQAQALHADLGRLGYANVAHYEVASATIGRELVSLTELTAEEAGRVWQHACLVRGYSTPVSRYYGAAAA